MPARLSLLLRLTTFVLLGLPCTTTLLAQDAVITGRVRDAAGAPIPGVNVVLENTTLGDATEPDGSFRIGGVPPGTHTLAASAIGYHRAERRVVLANGEVLDIELVLREATLESEELVVTASRREQVLSRAPVSISVLESEELEARNVLSLDDALRYVPGIQMADNQVNIRGSSGFSFNTGSRVLLLLDGMPLLSPERESIPYDALPLSQVDRIEVVKGPGSALYGGGALGGVINLITRDYPDAAQSSIRLFGGVYEPVRYDVWRNAWEHAGTARPFAGLAAAHARRLSDVAGLWVHASIRGDQGYMNYQKERDIDVFAKFGWTPDASIRFDVLGGWTWRKSDSFLYWNGLRDPLNPGRLEFTGADMSGTNDNRTNQFSLLPSFRHLLQSNLFYTVKARLIGVVIQPLDERRRPRPVSEGTVGFRYGGEVQVNWTSPLGQYITAGMTGDALATASSFFQPDEAPREFRSQPEGAAFVQVEQTFFERLDVVAGLRYDLYNIDEGHTERKLSPKVNVAYALSPALTLRGAFGQGFRVPGVAERFVQNQAFLPILSNLDLRPETSTSYELGVRALGTLRGNVLGHVDLAVFWNDYEQLVEPKFIARERAFQFVNLTRARIVGFESVVEMTAGDGRRRLLAGYTFLDADDLTEDKPLVFRSRHLVKASLSTALLGPLHAGLDYRFASKPERVDSDFARFVRDAEATTAIHVLDARLALHWSRLRLTFLVNNALEYYYVERPAILAPPRHYTLQLHTTF